ncbi:Alpha/Beta hydrolase protein [Melanogaster broomeanus]|nr:Alpha/Beta hydrolase protein [Melanogaster broomeanus]
MANTIPYTPSPEWESVNPRQLLPIHVHPNLQNIQTPSLPSPPRPRVFHTTPAGIYLRSTHLTPAAFPRLIPDISLPRYLSTHLVDLRLKDSKSSRHSHGSVKVLWNCINRYVRTRGNETRRVLARNAAGITLFLAHAGGFPKEIWETMLRSLLDSPAGYMIDEVWAWEAVQHGDSGLVNAHNLSGISDWWDDARDIAHFLLSYLPEDPETEALPAHLERLPESISEARKEHGYRTRKMVVVGHCFGGCTSLRAAVDFPKLFSSIILVDPAVIQPYKSIRDFYNEVLRAFSRRNQWASREDALRLFKKLPFFRTWKPEVLQLYVDHGLTDDSNGGVKLKMSGVHEGLCLVGYMACWEMWELMDKVDEAITLRWIVPEGGFMGEEATKVRVWRRPANSSNVIFSSGHLIVQEAPVELGMYQYRRWHPSRI